MKIDQKTLSIRRRYSRLWRVYVSMHAGNLGVLPLYWVKHLLPLQGSPYRVGDAVVLLGRLGRPRTLLTFKELRDIGLPFRTQVARHRHSHGGKMNGGVVVYYRPILTGILPLGTHRQPGRTKNQ